MLVNIYMKFHEDTLNGFQVTERTRFCVGQIDRQRDGRTDGQTDGQTDGRTTRAKRICLPTLKGENIMSIYTVHKNRRL